MSVPLIDAARACVKLGWWIFPLGEKSKVTDVKLAPHSHKSASNDPAQIEAWWTASPNSNIGIDLGRSGLTILDFDNGEPPPELNLNGALRVKTGRGTHVYFSGVSKQGKMYFNGQPVGDIKSEGGYVLAPNSIHPSGAVYTVAGGKGIEPITSAILDRLRSGEKTSVDASPNGASIPHGQHDTTLFKIACKLRGLELEEEAIYNAVVEVCEKRCVNYGSDYKEMCRKVTQQAMKFKPGNSATELVMDGSTAKGAAIAAPVVEEPAELNIKQVEYPAFPNWVMEGTSLYENFVKPICDVDCRIPYFMWMPAMVLLLNYVSPRLRIKTISGCRDFHGNVYMVTIGRRGQTMKSSSFADAKNYFQNIGCLIPYTRDLKAAEGKIITSSVGSMESLGLQMQKTNAKSALLYYDELETLAKKAGIESSSMKSHMLTTYEGNNAFENGVKSTKESFSIQPPYCISIIANTTVKKFPQWWATLTDADSGWDNRFVFILEPKEMPEPSLMQGADWRTNAVKTRMLIDKALNQAEFAYDDIQSPAMHELVKTDNRLAARAEKWAVAFAIDLGRTSIDDDCIERAVALVKYEVAVKKFHRVHAAVTKEGRIQQDIRRVLEAQPKARIQKRDLLKACKANQYGTTLWGMSYGGLIKNGIIREDGTGVKLDPVIVRVLVPLDTEDDDE